MFKIRDKLQIGDIYIVSVEGDTSLLKNDLKLIDEKGNIFEIDTVGMPHYNNIKDSLIYAELVLKCEVEAIGEIMQIMNNQTIKRLEAAGWYADRKTNINIVEQKYREIGLEMPDNIRRFLIKFGMLKIDSPDKKYYDVEFNPLKAIGVNLDKSYFEQCLSEYGISNMVYPIGVACRENLIVLMTSEDVFYCFTDGCLIKAGDNIEEMLDCLVGECRDAIIIE